jgi:hypothetical protein
LAGAQSESREQAFTIKPCRWTRGTVQHLEIHTMVNIGAIELILVLAFPALIIWACWRIRSKAGFPGALGLLIVIPLANLLLLFFLAFAEWPADGKRARFDIETGQVGY